MPAGFLVSSLPPAPPNAMVEILPQAAPPGGTGDERHKPRVAKKSGAGTTMVWNFGFDDGMGVTYAMQELDGDIRKIEYVDTTPAFGTVGGLFEPGDLNRGRAIKPDHVPTKFLWGGPKNRKIPLCSAS